VCRAVVGCSKTTNGDTGDVADNSYNLYAEDIALMQAIGVNAFRFSISWSRVVRADGSINTAGVQHYSALVDALLAAKITPWVTLYHWDLPQAFATPANASAASGGLRGWLNDTYIVPLFATYADACFGALGDRVKHWATFNEPHSFCFSGYESGEDAPGRCSDRTMCVCCECACDLPHNACSTVM
jgi:beta-glucosidase